MVGEVVVIAMKEVNGVREGEANSTSLPQGDAGVQDNRAEGKVTGGGYEENLRMTFAMTCSATTLKMKTTDNVITTTGSTFSPGDSSV